MSQSSTHMLCSTLVMCKDKARQSKNKRFQFLWQYVAGVCRLQRQKQQEKLARLQRIHEQ